METGQEEENEITIYQQPTGQRGDFKHETTITICMPMVRK